MTFVELRKSLTPTQRQILDKLWKHVVEFDAPMPERVLLRWVERQTADEALRRLGGTVVSRSIGPPSLQPTLLGALLSSAGPDLEMLLQRCLGFVRGLYAKAPETTVSPLPATRVQQGCRFETSEQLDHVRLVLSRPIMRRRHLSIDHDLPLCAAGTRGSSWNLFVFDDVDDLLPVSNFSEYIHRRVMERFDPTCPIHEDDLIAQGIEQVQPGTSPVSSGKESRTRQSETEALYCGHTVSVLNDLRRKSRITYEDLRILAEDRFPRGSSTIKHRSFQLYVERWRANPEVNRLLNETLHGMGRWGDQEEDQLQKSLSPHDRRILAKGRRVRANDRRGSEKAKRKLRKR